MYRLLRLLEETMSRKTLVAKVGMVAMLWSPLLMAADAQRCTISRDVLRPYTSATATAGDFAASRRAFYARQNVACAPTPWSAAEKAVLFDWLAKEMLVDWQSEFTAWERRGVKVDEFSSEAVAHFQRALLDTIDAVTNAGDMRHRETILRYGSGKAIAKLGSAMHADVLAAAQRPALLTGLGRKHNPQEEAIRAIGIWLDPAEKAFSATEKGTMSRTLMELLSDDGTYQPGDYKLTNTLIRALGSSDSAEVAQKLSTWHHLNESRGGGLAAEAAQAAQAVRERIQKSM